MSTMPAANTHQVTTSRVLEAVRAAISTGARESAVHDAIGALGTSGYNISDFLSDCERVKAELRDADPERVPKLWSEIDAIIAAVVHATSCVHETVLETCTRGYATLDAAGRVNYANDALLALEPGLVGRQINELFPINGDTIDDALSATQPCGPFRLEMHAAAGPIPVTVDIGPVRLDDSAVAHYALIGDIRPYMEAQAANFQASPFGVLRVDRHHRIQFANGIAEQRLKQPAPLAGMAAEELFVEGERKHFAATLDATFDAGDGFVLELDALCPDDSTVPIRMFGFPEHDPQRRRTSVLIFFRSLEIERAREKIYRACEGFRTPEAMLEELFAILREVIPFEQATFGMYTEGMRYFKTLFAQPQASIEERAQWFAIPPELVSWVKGDKTWEDDIDAFFARYPAAAELFSNPLVQAFRALGYQSFISLPVKQNDGVSTVLSLISKKRGQYGKDDFDRLRELPVEQALRMAQEGFLQRRRNVARETLKRFAEAKSHHDLAHVVIHQISDAFGWDHVSIFKVNHLDRRFELLDQVDRTNGKFTIAANYTQAIDAGMMASALRSGEIEWLDDTTTNASSQPYVSVCPDARSAMCVPIRLDGTVNWILDIETGFPSAFHGPDLEAVQSVMEELTRALERSFQAQLTENVLNLTDQGVVVIDAQGRIRNANTAAQQLLGGPLGELKGRPFVDFATEEDRSIFAEKRSSVERHVQIKDLTGALRPAIISLRRPIEEYDHKIWLLTDTTQRDWNIELRYLRETVHDVAQQTRVPLMAAGNLVKRATRLLDNAGLGGQVRDLADKAIAQLGKADITYERLIEGLTDRRCDDARASLNLADCVKSVLSELPADDREEIVIESPAAVQPVFANRNAMDFVFRSVLFYLLRKKPIRQKVKIRISSSEHEVKVKISTKGLDDGDPSRPDDGITACEQDARITAALAPDALEAIIASHHGHIRLPIPANKNTRFEISLPTGQAAEVLR